MGKKWKLRIVKYILLILALFYIAGVLWVPVMRPLAGSFIAWLIFSIYVLNLAFVWAISGKRTAGEPKADENSRAEAKISSELLRDRNKWVL